MKTSGIIKRSMLLAVCLLPILLGCGKKTKKSERSTAENQDEQLKEEKIALQTVYKSRLADVPKQKFKLSVDTVSFLVAEKGTVIYVQPGSFTDENGKTVTGEISLEVSEVITMQDFVKVGISTMAGEKILETGGTFYIQASKDGKPLKINPKVGLGLAIPSVEKKPDMQLFYGEMIKDSLNPNGVNWVLANGPEKDPDDLDEPTAPNEILDPLEGLEKNEVALHAEYVRAEMFLKDIEKNYKLEGSQYVYVGTEGRRISYEANYVNKLRRKLAALKAYKKFLDYKRNFYRKKNAALYAAWEKYKQQLDEYEAKMFKSGKPTFYELKLKQSGPWFNCDRYSILQQENFVCRIIRKKDKKPALLGRIHIIDEKMKVHIQRYLTKEMQGKFSFPFPKNREFKIVIERGKEEAKEFVYDGKKTDLGDIEV